MPAGVGPGLGHRSYLQIGKESAFGTAVPATQKLELISCNLAPVIGTIPDPSLYVGVSPRAIFQGGLYFRGTLVVRLNYDSMLELLRALWGGYTTAVVEANLVLDHFFRETSTLPSYTMEVNEGDVNGTSGRVFRLVGCKFANATFRVSAGQGADAMVQAEFTILAKDKQADVAPTASTSVGPVASCTVGGTANSTLTRSAGNFTSDGVTTGMTISCAGVPAGTTVLSVGTTTLVMSNPGTAASGLSATFASLQYPQILPVLFHQSILNDDGTGDSPPRVRSLEVTIEQPHAEDRFYLGSLNPDEALRNDFLNGTFKITQEFTTITQFNIARTFTQGSPQFKFQHPTSIGVSSKREFELRSGSANLTDFSAPVEGFGILVSTATWKAFLDPTDLTAILARVRNGQTALA